jgi:hypothetical protein
MCFVWISEQTAIISPYNINWLCRDFATLWPKTDLCAPHCSPKVSTVTCEFWPQRTSQRFKFGGTTKFRFFRNVGATICTYKNYVGLQYSLDVRDFNLSWLVATDIYRFYYLLICLLPQLYNYIFIMLFIHFLIYFSRLGYVPLFLSMSGWNLFIYFGSYLRNYLSIMQLSTPAFLSFTIHSSVYSFIYS